MFDQFKDKYQQLTCIESLGQHAIGVQVLVYINEHKGRTDLTTFIPSYDEVKNLSESHELRKLMFRLAGYGEQIQDDITRLVNLRDPVAAADKEIEKRSYYFMFVEAAFWPNFMEAIPNGYCSKGCCVQKPWYLAHTSAGAIEIGWRKSVINIDWSRTIIEGTGESLFPNEDVTRGDKYIHAHGAKKAIEYLTVLANAKTKEQV